MLLFKNIMKAQELREKNKKMSVIKQLRDRLELTQEELARELNISVWSVAKWEGGKHNPSFNFRQLKALYCLLARTGLSILDLPDNNWDELPNRSQLKK